MNIKKEKMYKIPFKSSLLINGEIDKYTLNNVYEFLKKEDKNKHILINSGGGDVLMAMSIADLIRNQNVTVVCLGTVQSAALIILLAAKKKLAYLDTVFMSHQISATSKLDTFLSYFQSNFLSHVRDRTNRLHKLNQVEIPPFFGKYHFDSYEALQKGIIDDIIE